MLSWLIVGSFLIAWWRRRRALAADGEPVDRVAIVGTFLDGAAPRISRALPQADEKPADTARLIAKSDETRQRIGRVALVGAMTPCDEVTRWPFYTNRDFGDENDWGRA